GVVVREERPGVAIGAVVLADGAPGTFGQVRTPEIPRARGIEPFLETTRIAQPVSLHAHVRARRLPASCRRRRRRSLPSRTRRPPRQERPRGGRSPRVRRRGPAGWR